MNRTAIKKTAVVLLTFLLSFSDKMATAQAITTVDPDTGMVGQSISVSIYGQNTIFSQGTSLNSWLDKGPSTLTLAAINAVNDTLLTGILNIPSNAPTGYWDVFVYNDSMGTVTKLNGFQVIPNPLVVSNPILDIPNQGAVVTVHPNPLSTSTTFEIEGAVSLGDLRNSTTFLERR